MDKLMNKANSIVLVGTLSRVPQIQQIQRSFHLMTFAVHGGLLISEEGKKEDQAIRVVLWCPTGDLLLANLKPGSLISIKGSLQKAAMAAYHDEQLLEIFGGQLTLLSN
jgi:single-stranded DNA-binding protein